METRTLERCLIVVLAIGFITLLGNELNFWGPSIRLANTGNHKTFKPDTLSKEAQEDSKIAPLPEYGALELTE